MDIKKELSQYNVSRETIIKLEKFADLLREWNQKMNLVSRNSMEVLWERHILDSMQLINYVPSETKRLVDIGSGAGFPGLILAIMLQEKNPDAQITLVESITKKTVYLKDICAKLGLSNVEVKNDRVENAVLDKPDIITARAVASLNILCKYVAQIGKTDTKALFLKGCSYIDEVADAQKSWRFDMEVFPNKYSDDGVVLKISRLKEQK